MSFTCKSTEIPEVKIIEGRRFEDKRGYFCESFRVEDFESIGLPAFVQENHSFSHPYTIRGMHYQLNPKAQGKLVYCVSGIITDFAVDIRKGSPTYGEHVRVVLSGDSVATRMVYVPPGFAHGFQVGSTTAHVIYKVTDYYSPEHEASIRWNDPAIGIKWSEQTPLIAPKDAEAPLFGEAENNFVYGE